MRLLHTADWHLGKRLGPYSRLAEQADVLDEICQIADDKNVDVVLIAGDLYDTPNPPIEAIELFYRTLKRLSRDGNRPVVAIAGNHDAPDRIEAPHPLARECGIILTGYPHSHVPTYALPDQFAITQSAPGFIELSLPDHPPLRLILTPYANEARFKKALDPTHSFEDLHGLLRTHWQDLSNQYLDNQGINILMTHLFVLGNAAQETEEDFQESEEERSIRTVGGTREIFTNDFPSQLQYVALGHLHGYIEVQKAPFPIIYSSSPLCYAVDDRQKQKHVVLVDLEPQKPASYQKIALTKGKPALQQSFDGVDQAIEWLLQNPNTWVECLIQTDQHLTAQDRKKLLNAHDGILRIIPQFTDPDLIKFTSGKQIDLTKQIGDLFADYFLAKKKQTINEDLSQLFQEIVQFDTES